MFGILIAKKDLEKKVVNILLLLTPKGHLKYLESDNTARQGLEKMRYTGFTAIPVIVPKTGEYVGTISEGAFLWEIVDKINNNPLKRLEDIDLVDLIDKSKYKSVNVETSLDELVQLIMFQNFVPVVDDRNVFMGIVTRRAVIDYYYNRDNDGDDF